MDEAPKRPGSGHPCIVLMFKAPERSKRRLAQQIGDFAAAAADCLLDCALEDVESWPGPVCFSPAAPVDLEWLTSRLGSQALVVAQSEGNLGQRINHVNRELWSRGHTAQIFIGIDCPGLGPRYLEEAAAALADNDVVLGPALDGGAVLIGAKKRWPALGDLAWSDANLLRELVALCTSLEWKTIITGALADVDTAADLYAAADALSTDQRLSRRALCAWVDTHAARLAPFS